MKKITYTIFALGLIASLTLVLGSFQTQQDLAELVKENVQNRLIHIANK